MDYRKVFDVKRVYRKPIDTSMWHGYLGEFFPYRVSCPPGQNEWTLEFLERLSEEELKVINQAAEESDQDERAEELYIIIFEREKNRKESFDFYRDRYGLAAEVCEASVTFSDNTAVLRIVVKYPSL